MEPEQPRTKKARTMLKDILKSYPLKEFKLERIFTRGDYEPHPNPTNRFILVNPKPNQGNWKLGWHDPDSPDLPEFIEWDLFENWKEGLKPKRKEGVYSGNIGIIDVAIDEAEYQKEIRFYNLLFVEGMEVENPIWSDSIKPLVKAHINPRLSITETEPYKFVI